MQLYPSRHAPAVVETCQRAQVIEPHQGRRRYVRNGLAVVVAADGTVVTVLLRTSAQWTDEDFAFNAG